MSQLEIIHLRTAGKSFAPVARQIHEALAPQAAGTGVLTVYRRDGLDTDLAVHIIHPESGDPTGPSPLGLHLASAMSAYGLVEHTVWEELT